MGTQIYYKYIIVVCEACLPALANGHVDCELFDQHCDDRSCLYSLIATPSRAFDFSLMKVVLV